MMGIVGGFVLKIIDLSRGGGGKEDEKGDAAGREEACDGGAAAGRVTFAAVADARCRAAVASWSGMRALAKSARVRRWPRPNGVPVAAIPRVVSALRGGGGGREDGSGENGGGGDESGGSGGGGGASFAGMLSGGSPGNNVRFKLGGAGFGRGNNGAGNEVEEARDAGRRCSLR